ncbi:MAG TPA: sulfurtransferase [Ramlibacter sp.]|jgi:thiosulfate/3-mercaptopyruvate sulfurtransferase|nr:sulfurtransferase [Ramlibacter sp.]
MAVPFAHPEYLVGTQWLAEHLADPQVRVLDGTTHLPPLPDLSLYDVVSGRADFEKGHIPGAGFVDIEHELSTPHPRLHFMLPTAEAFAATMGRLGIGNDTHVVTYATGNHWWATRLWWMLRVFGHDRVSVLDGGFQKWQSEGRPLETGAPRAQAPRAFTARMRPEMVATREDILAAVGRGETCTVNALRPEQHAGTGGVHYGRRGHITGSVNIPALHHIRPDNTFRDADELRALFAPALAAPEVLTYCGGGIAATSVALVLAMLGHERVKVYDNSLTEWAADPALPMETGA